MKFLLKAVIPILIALLIVASTYVIFFTSDEGEDKDNEPPTIDSITGDTTGTVGKITTIYVEFSDNVGVTEAIMYYKTVSEENWRSTSIINGSAGIVLPSNSKKNWQYYVTVNDAANNGPVGDPSIDGSSYYTITVSFENEDLTHYVFVEEGTVTGCIHCPDARDIVQALFESGKYNFYYVSMVLDKSDIAEDRLKKDYNMLGYPTVFVDGGFSVIAGAKEKSVYDQAIRQAEARDAAKIQVTVNAEYNKNTNELITDVVVNNYENETYTGRLRVYLTEIISRWVNHHSEAPEPYHYGFIDYIINEEITVDADGIFYLPHVTKKFSDFSFSDLDPENLMVVAVVFNSESIEKYAYPPDENPFDAYFADNADAAKVVEGGNLPPSVAICNPSAGYVNLFGYPIIRTRGSANTILIGRSKFALCIEDDSSIEKAEFYIDGELRYTDTEEPYEWSFRKVGLMKHIIRRHTLMVKGYDDEGKTSTDSIEVIAFFL